MHFILHGLVSCLIKSTGAGENKINKVHIKYKEWWCRLDYSLPK